MQPQRIVIVGAGFVGLPTARTLAARLRHTHAVTLIDEKDVFQFSPRLIDLLARPDATHVVAPLKQIAARDGFTYVQGHTLSVDRARKIVFVQEPQEETLTPVPYDALVLASGSETNFFGVPGTDTFAFPLKSVAHVEQIHARANELIAAAIQSPESAEALLTVAVVGGGPSGLEALFAIKGYLECALAKSAPALVHAPRLHLVQAAPQILPGFPPNLVNGTMDELAHQGITAHLGDAAAKLGDGFLLTSKGTRINSHLVIWCAGILPRRIEAIPPYAVDKSGCLSVDQSLRIEPGVFAAGDCALYRERNVVIPKNAQTAMMMSATIANNIVREAQNLPLKPFRYVSRGNLLSYGTTGYLDMKFFQWKTRIAPWVRDLFYRVRFTQITGL